MRYLGNKTKLVPFILERLSCLGIEPGVACDPFAGTASVARALKRTGWRVHCGDLMAFSYALQVARVELDHPPRFRGAGGGRRASSRSYRAVLEALGSVPAVDGFITEHFTPAGAEGARHGRMYFTTENGRRIDAVRARIAALAADGGIDRTREQLLLATLIEAADRVANTTGVYASFVKSWQPNALRPLGLRPLRPQAPGRRGNGTAAASAARPNGRRGAGRRARGPASDGSVSREPGPGCTAFRGPAVACVSGAGTVDLLYLDPPYNERQYPAYYHIPELIARGWDPEPELRGKTGLIPDDELRSDWCRRARVEEALRGLLGAADARHVLLSYNDEGLLSADRVEAIFRESGDPDSYRRFERRYKRYRSDADGPRRNYARDRVSEVLHYVRRG